MANSLNADLTGKVVVFRENVLRAEFRNWPFYVEGGFGAQAFTMGRALIGTFLHDGEEARFDGFDVERLATDEELAALPPEAAERLRELSD